MARVNRIWPTVASLQRGDIVNSSMRLRQGGPMSIYGSGQTWNERISFGFEKIGSLSKGCAYVWGDVSYGKRGT